MKLWNITMHYGRGYGTYIMIRIVDEVVRIRTLKARIFSAKFYSVTNGDMGHALDLALMMNWHELGRIQAIKAGIIFTESTYIRLNQNWGNTI